MGMHENTQINTVCRHGDKLHTHAGGRKCPEMELGPRGVPYMYLLLNTELNTQSICVKLTEEIITNVNFFLKLRNVCERKVACFLVVVLDSQCFAVDLK